MIHRMIKRPRLVHRASLVVLAAVASLSLIFSAAIDDRSMSGPHSLSERTWIHVHFMINDGDGMNDESHSLEWECLQQAYRHAVDPRLMVWRKMRGGIEKFMSQPGKLMNVATIKPRKKAYEYALGDRFDEELTRRHPGDDWRSNARVVGDSGRFAPIRTLAAFGVRAIAFASKEDPVMLASAYPMQLAVRVDEGRHLLVYDCHEFRPQPFDVTAGQAPSNREATKAELVLQYPPGPAFDEKDYDSDVEWEAPVKNRNGRHSRESLMDLALRVTAATYVESRQFRIRLDLDKIDRVFFFVPSTAPDSQPACLVLDVTEPVDDFAVRRIANPRRKVLNQFARIGDWTQSDAASHASRHYIVAELDELTTLVHHLCALSPTFKAKIQGGEEESLSSLLSPAAAPDLSTETKKRKVDEPDLPVVDTPKETTTTTTTTTKLKYKTVKAKHEAWSVDLNEAERAFVEAQLQRETDPALRVMLAAQLGSGDSRVARDMLTVMSNYADHQSGNHETGQSELARVMMDRITQQGDVARLLLDSIMQQGQGDDDDHS